MPNDTVIDSEPSKMGRFHEDLSAHLPSKQRVLGSNPNGRATFWPFCAKSVPKASKRPFC
jgi:hypothetical protein